MAKVGDLLSQIKKKKESATKAADHKHQTPDQLVNKEIKKNDPKSSNTSKVVDDAGSTNNSTDETESSRKTSSQLKSDSLASNQCEHKTDANSNTSSDAQGSVIANDSVHPPIAMDQQRNNKEPNTTKHNQTQQHTTEHKNNRTQLDTTKHKIVDNFELNINKINSLTIDNQTQLNTELTTHNYTQPNTTEHKKEINDSNLVSTKAHNRTQLDTTKHNRTPQGTQLDTDTKHNRTQELHTTEHIISNLSGIKSQVLNFLCQKALEVEIPVLTMTYEMLAEFAGVKKGSIKTTCMRLKSLNLIGIHSSSGGRSQMTGFEVYPETKNAYSRIRTLNKVNIFNISTAHNQTQEPNTGTAHNQTQPHTTLNTTAPSKLVSINNNNLLTRSDKNVEVEDQDLLDVSAIDFHSFKSQVISRKQIQDIKNQRLNFTTATLQDFVDRFAIYVSDPKNIKGVNSIPAIFVKMAQLASKGQDPLIDIETDTDRLIRERLERLKVMKEERLKQKQELLELEFENWLEEIDLDQIEKIAPTTAMMKQGSVAQKMTLKNYFIESVWVQKAGNLFFNQIEI
jgi:hypothetical protein